LDHAVTRASANDFRRRTRRRQPAVTLWTHGDQSSFLEPPLEYRVIARGITAVIADPRAKQTRADEDLFHDPSTRA